MVSRKAAEKVVEKPLVAGYADVRLGIVEVLSLARHAAARNVNAL
jgi:hypothetical protein